MIKSLMNILMNSHTQRVVFSALIGLSFGHVATAVTATATANDEVSRSQTTSGTTTFNLDGIGERSVEGDRAVYKYGELDCTFVMPTTIGSAAQPSKATCTIANGRSVAIQIDQPKPDQTRDPEQFNLMYLVQRAVGAGVDVVALDFRDGYGATTYRLHARAIECRRPKASTNWQDFECSIETVYAAQDKTRGPTVRPNSTVPPRIPSGI